MIEACAQIQLRAKPHQQRVLDTLHLRRSFFNEHRHLVVAATGTGKTVMSALDYARLCEPGKPRPRLLFVAHREQILQQARDTFRQALHDPGFGELLSGSSGALRRDAHVFAMVQTLRNRLTQVSADAYDVIYIGEAHHGAATTWREVIDHFSPREIVGLTATPERMDGTSITDLFGGEYTTDLRLWEAVDDQLLAPFTYVGVDDGTDLRQLGWRHGDYAVGDLSALYTGDHERVKRIAQAMHRWVEDPAEMRVLGFCVSVEHAIFMAEQFTRLGLQADHLSGDHDLSHREAVLAKLNAGGLRAVFSVEVLGEGVDVPYVDTLLLLRPTQSPVLFAQQLGRGLRTAPGKAGCLVLDFIGQHRAEYRFEERFKAMLDPSRGSIRAQAENGFPFLPSGCTMHLERVARERVLGALKAVAAKPGIKGLKQDLLALGTPSLGEFLSATGRSIEHFYGADGRTMSWTRLRRLVRTATAPPEHPRSELQADEAQLLRRVGHLQHVADPLRVNTWVDWLTSAAPPVASAFSRVEQRLAMQLMHLLLMTPPTLEAGFERLWRHDAVRAEIAELLTLVHADLDASPIPLMGLVDVPLMAHARYNRAEVFAAMGISTVDTPKEHREGVYFAATASTQLMFVTLHKDNARFSSTVQYKDHAVSTELLHGNRPIIGGNKVRPCGHASETEQGHRGIVCSSCVNEATVRSKARFDASGRLICTENLREIVPSH